VRGVYNRMVGWGDGRINFYRFPISRRFNVSVNIPESCDFQSQFDPLNIIFSFFLKYFLSAYTF